VFCPQIPEMRLQSFISPIAALVAASGAVHATPLLHRSNDNDLAKFTFRSQSQNNTNLRYVANSGICETTPGVNQYSGYIDVGPNMSMVS
jgi:hypothetical protein